MHVLARLGPMAKDALPALRPVARDSDLGNRAFALWAIASIGPEPKDVPLLVRALSDEHSIVRIQGARGLGGLGNLPNEPIAMLTNALQDKDEGRRKQVAAALTKLNPDGAAK